MMKDILASLRARAGSKRLLVALSLLLLCATLAATWLIIRETDSSKGLSLLRDAYRHHRPIRSRVAGFDYAPIITTRGGAGESGPDKLRLRHAEMAISDAAYYRPDGRSNHALGVFHLLNKEFDQAIKRFEKALIDQPSNAQLHSDLGAALMEKARVGLEKERQQLRFTGEPIEEMSRALEHLRKALSLDASLTSAAFNLGLLQEQSGLRFAARASFSEYLKRDSDSGWAGEVREMLSGLDEKERLSSSGNGVLLAGFFDAFNKKDEERAWRLIRQYRSPLNDRYLSEMLVDSYIDQSLASRKEEAAKTLAALSFLADLERRRAGERYCEKLVAFYRGQPESALAQLKQARSLVVQGHNLYLLDRGLEAAGPYQEAKRIFDALDNRCESASAEYRIAFCWSESRYADSLPLFESLTSLCERENFKSLLLRTILGVASNEFSKKNYSNAIKYGLRSLEVGVETGDEPGILTSLTVLTEYYRAIGNYKKALACIQNSLEYSDCPSINQIQRFVYYSRVASTLFSAGQPESSLEYRKEASQFLTRDIPRGSALYFAELGATYSKLGQHAEASENLEYAYQQAQAISPESLKSLILTYATLLKGSFHKDRKEFQEALARYDAALDSSRSANFPAYSYQARKGRLFCYLGLGEDALAEREIGETLELLEKSRSDILEYENRNSFFDAEQDIYDLAIDYAHSRRNDPHRALDYSEESRARSLLDALKTETSVTSHLKTPDIGFNAVSRPLTAGEIQEKLPEHLQVVQYSVLADKVVIWVLSQGSIRSADFDISQEELGRDVKTFLGHIDHYSEEESSLIEAQSQRLFDVLIRPVSDLLKPGETICIVPDKALSVLPFDALLSKETRRYLIEDFPIIYSPSASVLIECNERARVKAAAGAARLFAIGNPDFDASLLEDGSNLEDAEEEVAKISAFYPDNLPLINRGAREERVKQEMQRASVIHIATHSILDEYSPFKSKILLAREASPDGKGNDGVLESHEIFETKLPNARLVVLSSCQSGIDKYYRGEGMLSLSRSFLAAGAPMVVASLWEVDSKATARLMVEFHRLKQEPRPAAESLRIAKLNMLKSRGGPYRHPYFWAPFLAVGGQESFGKATPD